MTTVEKLNVYRVHIHLHTLMMVRAASEEEANEIAHKMQGHLVSLRDTSQAPIFNWHKDDQVSFGTVGTVAPPDSRPDLLSKAV